MGWSVQHAKIIADTAKAQNVDILASDITPKASGRFRITVVGTAAKIEVKPSSGSAFYLNGGSALTLDAAMTEVFLFDGRGGRTFNLASDDGSGITVKHLVIEEFEE